MPSLPLPELVRDGVVLRGLKARDAGPFAAAFRDDPRLGSRIGAEDDPTEADARRLILRMHRLRARGEFLGLAVSDVTRTPFLGHVMLHTFHWHHRRAEVGYWLVPQARGRRVGRAAVSMLVDWAFETLPLERIEMLTTPDNAPARALGLALGFEEEGIMRGRNVERGRRVDILFAARLRK